ncbi:MAG: hypothetical protein U0163_03950 [Gemmatimonadaceae bacterium]
MSAFAERLADLPREALSALGAHDDASLVDAAIASIVVRRRLQLQSWFVRDLVSTALFIAFRKRPPSEGDQWQATMRRAAETAALALLTRDALVADVFATAYAPFAAAIPLASL